MAMDEERKIKTGYDPVSVQIIKLSKATVNEFNEIMATLSPRKDQSTKN